MPAIFTDSKGGTDKNTLNLSWASKLANKLQIDKNRFELRSEDGEGRHQEEMVIHVQKTWVTKTNLDLEEEDEDEEDEGRISERSKRPGRYSGQ
jgi:hypothetical protein